ncbi:EAL domain-containing protein [Maribrevibacterium harenarium]|uniref:EAL domain-containing protein n=1 Tax=Maribrevibacterium harenarium TaxID=2589817 RepID=A0A501WL86_9GAMM|nr:EAL domain-containing protein [Maribrevibacterium harenarium]TPE48904.1 EAL domain-containing protein [Maribrevibacterium harenarium]
MTLFRQLLLTIVALLSLMLLVVMGINFQTTKDYLVNQLQNTTQDSATSLSMQVSDFMAYEDYAAVESSVNAVFDSGYFSEVRIHVYATDKDIRRTNDTQVKGVPGWFISAIDFRVPTAKAVISNGWSELGQVYVTGSAGYGYYQLWLATRDLLISFVIIGGIWVALGGLALRWLFRPLVEVERQAEAIQQRRFVKMTKLPKTRELKSVVESMNRMAEKLEKEFAAEAETAQWLQAKAFKDPVSNLGNRNFFESQAQAHFSAADRATDGLMLISLADLAKLNNERGYEAADTLIRSAAQVLSEQISQTGTSATLARLSGADFIVLITNIDYEGLTQLAEAIMLGLKELVPARISYSESVANIGAVLIDENVDRSNAMAQADAALRAAKTAGINATRVFDLETGQEMAIGRMAWKDMLESAIEKRAFSLRKQPVMATDENGKVLQQEVFASLEYGGKQYHAGYFIGLAEQFDLGDEIDKVVIDLVIERLPSLPKDQQLTINLAASAYAKTTFLGWLDRRLGALDLKTRQQLAFEISEQSVLATEDHAFLLAQTLKRHQVAFGIDNVGKQFSAFQYLQTLMPDYVKVDPSYTKLAVGKDSESFFMHTLCKMFNSLNIKVFATGVETAQQAQTLARFDIAGVQGFGVGRAESF